MPVSFLVDEALVSLARGINSGRPCFLHLALSPSQFDIGADERNPDDSSASRIIGIDEQLGRFLDRLDASDLASRCCIFIVGESTPGSLSVSAGEEQQRTAGLKVTGDGLAEGNLRVPLLVRWPNHIAPGKVADHVCASWDLLPTLAELAAAQRKPLQSDGLSFAAELTGRPQRKHPMLYWETRKDRFGQAVRKGKWKAVRAPGQTTLALYDLEADPREQQDLADQHPDVVQQFIVRRR